MAADDSCGFSVGSGLVDDESGVLDEFAREDDDSKTQERDWEREDEEMGDPDAPAAAAPAEAPVGLAADPDLDGEPAPVGKFHVNAKRFHFTFKTWIPFNELKEAAEAWNGPLEAYSMVHEKGHSGMGYQHTHFAACWKKKLQTKNSRKFDLKGIHPHVKTMRDEVHWARVVKYHQKEVGAPLEQFGLDKVSDNPMKEAMRRIKAAKSQDEVWLDEDIAGAVSSRVNWVGKVFAASRPKVVSRFSMDEAEPWQISLLSLCDLDWNAPGNTDYTSPDKPAVFKSRRRWLERHIWFLYSLEGGHGKSVTAQHLFVDRHFIYLDDTDFKDAAHIISKQPCFDGIVIDLGRSFNTNDAKTFEAFCRALEKLRNGIFCSGKYDSSIVSVPTVPIIVFSNFPFPNDGVFLSKDKCIVFEINDEGHSPSLTEYLSSMLAIEQ